MGGGSGELGIQKGRLAFALLASAALLLPAIVASCAASGSNSKDKVRVVNPAAMGTASTRKPRAESSSRKSAGGSASETAPLARNAIDGLELHWWITFDDGGAVGSTLVSLSDGAPPLSPQTQQAWIENGLRMVRIPENKLPELEARLPAVRSLERTWFGWATEWTSLFIGRRAGGSGPVLIDGQPVTLAPGTLRLLARTWTAQGSTGPVLRLELAMQHQTRVADDVLATTGLRASVARTLLDEGSVFAQLNVDAALEPGWVYAISSERPGVEWSASRRKRTENDGDGEAGPKVSPPPTLGEAMLSQASDNPAVRGVKVVVVLVPRVPREVGVLR